MNQIVCPGLVVTMAAKAFGADRVAVAELNKDNLTAARTAGADACIRTAPGEAPAAVAARLKQALPPHGPEVVIDCVGFESTAQVTRHYASTASSDLMACAHAHARACFRACMRVLLVVVWGCFMPPLTTDSYQCQTYSF